jgi:hypothetical protein
MKIEFFCHVVHANFLKKMSQCKATNPPYADTAAARVSSYYQPPSMPSCTPSAVQTFLARAPRHAPESTRTLPDITYLSLYELRSAEGTPETHLFQNVVVQRTRQRGGGEIRPRACVNAAPQDNCPLAARLLPGSPLIQSYVTYLPATRSISCTSVSLSRTLPLPSPRLVRDRVRVRVRVVANLAHTLL